MQPGSDQNHFCQPTDVAVDPGSGTVYVSDGYCNSRLVQFSPSGRFITQWGEGTRLDSLPRLLILGQHHKEQEAGHPSFGREWAWPSHSLGCNCPLIEENRASTCIQLVVHSLFLTHTHTSTQSLKGRKECFYPKALNLIQTGGKSVMYSWAKILTALPYFSPGSRYLAAYYNEF